MGLKLGDNNIALDVRDREANVNFVSHAHADHIAGICKSKPLLASRITKELVEARSARIINDTIMLNNVKLLDAGHILGSKQLYAEGDGFTFMYSGDYQMQKSDVAPPIQTKQTDVLVIDATYPYKNVVFDNREEVSETIRRYLSSKLEKGTVIFGAYSLGKAQELVKIANDAGIAPVVGEQISRVNEVYRRNGVRLEYITAVGDESTFSESVSGNFFGIVPMGDVKAEMRSRLSNAWGKRVFTGVASGFAKLLNMGTDVQFCLSDHADFKQSVEYIEACSPRLIYTYGKGSGPALMAQGLRAEGYNAHPFKAKEMEVMACALEKG